MTREELQQLSKEELVAILSSADAFQVELLKLFNTLSGELEKVNAGELTELKILRSDDKLFERLVTMLKMRSDFSIALKEPEKKKAVKKVLNLRNGDNPYEHVLKHVKENGAFE
jgi:hypothetical protein